MGSLKFLMLLLCMQATSAIRSKDDFEAVNSVVIDQSGLVRTGESAASATDEEESEENEGLAREEQEAQANSYLEQEEEATPNDPHSIWNVAPRCEKHLLDPCKGDPMNHSRYGYGHWFLEAEKNKKLKRYLTVPILCALVKQSMWMNMDMDENNMYKYMAQKDGEAEAHEYTAVRKASSDVDEATLKKLADQGVFKVLEDKNKRPVAVPVDEKSRFGFHELEDLMRNHLLKCICVGRQAKGTKAFPSCDKSGCYQGTHGIFWNATAQKGDLWCQYGTKHKLEWTDRNKRKQSMTLPHSEYMPDYDKDGTPIDFRSHCSGLEIAGNSEPKLKENGEVDDCNIHVNSGPAKMVWSDAEVKDPNGNPGRSHQTNGGDWVRKCKCGPQICDQIGKSKDNCYMQVYMGLCDGGKKDVWIQNKYCQSKKNTGGKVSKVGNRGQAAADVRAEMEKKLAERNARKTK